MSVWKHRNSYRFRVMRQGRVIAGVARTYAQAKELEAKACLIAAFRALGRHSIPARIIPLDDLLDGEYAENMLRKNFTVSERVAIGEAMAARLGDRRGSNQYQWKEDPQNSAEAEPGEETRSIAAEYAGFGNHDTYIAVYTRAAVSLRKTRSRWLTPPTCCRLNPRALRCKSR
jgi:hypothetical protein